MKPLLPILAATLSLFLSQHAVTNLHAQGLERLTELKKPTKTQKTKEVVPVKAVAVKQTKPKAYSTCSLAYHADLQSILSSYAKPLRKAIVSGRARDKALPRNLVFKPRRLRRTRGELRAIRFASQTARSRGADPWLRSADGRWLTDALSIGLTRYTGQPENPFLCTGMKGYLGYLEPQSKKLSPITKARLIHAENALAAVAPPLEAVWLATKPAPLPYFNPSPSFGILETPIADVLRGTEPDSSIAERVQKKYTVEADEVTTQSVVKPADPVTLALGDPDLPPLKKTVKFDFSSSADFLSALTKLHDRLVETKVLDSNTQSPALQAGEDSLEAVRIARDWVTGRSPLIQDRILRQQVLDALSAMEVATIVERQASGLDKISGRFEQTFQAIRQAHAKNCTCSR